MAVNHALRKRNAAAGFVPCFEELSSFKIDAAAAADVAIAAAVADQKTRLYQIVLVAAADVTITVKSASTALTGAMTLTKGVPFILPFNGEPWFATAVNEALNITLGGAVQVSGRAYFLTT